MFVCDGVLGSSDLSAEVAVCRAGQFFSAPGCISMARPDSHDLDSHEQLNICMSELETVVHTTPSTKVSVHPNEQVHVHINLLAFRPGMGPPPIVRMNATID